MNRYYSKFTGKQIDAMLTMIAEQTIQLAVCKNCGAPLSSDGECAYCGTTYKYILIEKEKAR